MERVRTKKTILEKEISKIFSETQTRFYSPISFPPPGPPPPPAAQNPKGKGGGVKSSALIKLIKRACFFENLHWGGGGGSFIIPLTIPLPFVLQCMNSLHDHRFTFYISWAQEIKKTFFSILRSFVESTTTMLFEVQTSKQSTKQSLGPILISI